MISKICGHIGAAVFKPENTIPSFQWCVENNISWAECDVQLTKDDIPIIKESNNVSIKVLVGEIKDVKSSVQTYSPVSILDVNFFESNQISLDISKNQIAMVYVINGELQFIESNTIASKGQMVYFDQSSTEIKLTSISSSGSYLLLAGEPLKESIIRHGPFVTNTDEEMKKAMLDYQNGKMGILK